MSTLEKVRNLMPGRARAHWALQEAAVLDAASTLSEGIDSLLKALSMRGNHPAWEKGMNPNKRGKERNHALRGEVLDTVEWTYNALKKKKVGAKKLYSLYKSQGPWKSYRLKPISFGVFEDEVLAELEDAELITMGKVIKVEGVAGAPGAFAISDAEPPSLEDMKADLIDRVRNPRWEYPSWALPKVELDESKAAEKNVERYSAKHDLDTFQRKNIMKAVFSRLAAGGHSWPRYRDAALVLAGTGKKEGEYITIEDMLFAANYAKVIGERSMERTIREELKHWRGVAKEKGWKQKPPKSQWESVQLDEVEKYGASKPRTKKQVAWNKVFVRELEKLGGETHSLNWHDINNFYHQNLSAKEAAHKIAGVVSPGFSFDARHMREIKKAVKDAKGMGMDLKATLQIAEFVVGQKSMILSKPGAKEALHRIVRKAF